MKYVSEQPIPTPKSPLCRKASQLAQETQPLHGTALMIYTPAPLLLFTRTARLCSSRNFRGKGSRRAELFCSCGGCCLHKSKEFSALQPFRAAEGGLVVLFFPFSFFNPIHLGIFSFRFYKE